MASNTAAAKKSTTPSWIWMVNGLLVGVIACYLIMVNRSSSDEVAGAATDEKVEPQPIKNGSITHQTAEDLAKEAGDDEPESDTGAKNVATADKGVESKSASSAKTKASAKAASAESGDELYDFYRMPPESNTEVDAPEQKSSAAKTSSKPAAANKTDSATIKTATAKPSTPMGQGRYIIQAGAFAKDEQAQRRRAALVSLGYGAEVMHDEKVYRVRINNVASRDAALVALDKLKANNIDAFVVASP